MRNRLLNMKLFNNAREAGHDFKVSTNTSFEVLIKLLRVLHEGVFCFVFLFMDLVFLLMYIYIVASVTIVTR